MTTIAYKDGVIAFDSRMTGGDVIISDSINKVHTHKGVKFILSGAPCDFDEFFQMYFGEIDHEDTKTKRGVNGIALVYGNMYSVGYNSEDGFYSDAMPKHTPRAFGSGRDHALTAMDMGATAVEAIKMAKLRDIYTGGRVRTIKI